MHHDDTFDTDLTRRDALKTLVRDAQAPPPVITVTRQIGSSGDAVARAVAEKLDKGWQVWDNEIIEAIARSAGVQTKMVETLDGIGRRAAGDRTGARASFQRAALYLPRKDGLFDARLLGAARYLQKTTTVTGLPASAPAMAGRVQYNVGALLSTRGG